MLKKLAKYLKGLVWLCIISMSGMIIEAICELSLPKIANYIYETVKNAGDNAEDVKSQIIKIGIGMVVMAVFGLAGGLATMKASSIVSLKFSYRLRKDLFEKVSAFSFKNIDTFSTASLTTRMTNDVTMLQNTLMMMLRML